MKKKWTGERLERFILSRDTVDHLHRYAISQNFVEDKVVLDIASGEGYGSFLLSKFARKVFGVDIDSNTISNAKRTYLSSNLEFLEGDATSIPIENNSIDVVVSFETIEHHDKHEEMMVEIKRVLKPNGVLILSSPDKLEYSDKRSFSNPYHVKELYKDEFENLIQKHFKIHQFLSQSYVNGNSIIVPSTLEQTDTITYSGNYDLIEREFASQMYIIAIASDIEFEKQNLSVFDGSKILGEELELVKEQFRKSKSYILGDFLLKPFKMLKRVLK